MAKRRKLPIGTVSPIIKVGVPKGFEGKGSRPQVRTLIQGGPGVVWIGSDHPPVDVVGRLTGPATARPPRPRYEQTPRPGLVALNRFSYMEGYEQQIPIMFDAYAQQRSIEPMIRALETLAERTGPNGEPPVVRAIGPIPYGTEKTTVRWRVSAIEEDASRTIYLPGGNARCRFVCTVTLIQHVTDKQLGESIRRGKRAQGIASRKTKARAGEYLTDVARREFGDPGRAGDIARANPGIRLGQRLKAGQTVRLPT